MILDKYQSIKRLGKGAYGEVILAEDKKGTKYAIKMISKKSFEGQNEYLLEYIDSQVHCLKQMNSPYVMKLYETKQDDKYKYMICEYCDGGDIVNVQAKQPKKVFSIQKASQILSYVIRGLQCLHDQGYVHRDIKAQNILMKTENGKETYKLADFGFTKNIKDISYTVLGTGSYMSPEIYKQDQYGFEVDMWAFGVLFYFMLNMQFPFKPSQAPHTAKKAQELAQLGRNFSYKRYIQKSRKKLVQNCTDDIEDLFSKMFKPDPKERINFHEIRKHAIFVKHFPSQQVNELSKILYEFGKKKIKNIQKVNVGQQQNAPVSYNLRNKKNKNYPQESNIVEYQKNKIQFLKQSIGQILNINDLPFYELMSLNYNLKRYQIMLLMKFKVQLEDNLFGKNYPDLKFKQFAKTNDYTAALQQTKEELKKMEFQLQKVYNDCEPYLKDIIKVNPDFQKAFDKKVKKYEFQGTFKSSYRRSTNLIYTHLMKTLKNFHKKGNKLNYQLALATICHCFNKIFDDQKQLRAIFEEYFKAYSKDVKDIDFEELRHFLTSSSGGQLNAITKNIIDTFLKS